MIGLQQGKFWRHNNLTETHPLEAETPMLISVFDTRQKWILRLLVVIWLCSLIFFWSWWLRPEHWVTTPLMILSSVLLAWATIMSGWFFFFVLRMRLPNPTIPLPAVRVAMVVTKAPSEPWAIVRETLENMLRQDYPYPYDVWLADEDPDEETLAWCERHNVQVSCRKGVAEYHRTTWPRRTKCKEGNLAYFYDRWGFSNYDVVVQLDADHVPTVGYLSAMCRPFADSAVGYVAAPSICDRNTGESWVVRGRLFTEATLHGALQAGYHDGYAPLCIGSHYAVRTKALQQIGGLGPELAEDHTTTLMMNAHGWQGAFAIDAEAHGDGAGSFADSVVQELQWSRSLTNVLFGITRNYWSGLTRRKKVQFGFAQAWYPLYAGQMLLGYLVAPLALLIGQPWVRVDLLSFFAHSSITSLVCIGTVLWMRRQGWLRPVHSRVLSWEVVLFQFIRWPWVVLALVLALGMQITGKVVDFKVTPKGADRVKLLPLVTILPYHTLALFPALTALLVTFPGEAAGYYYLCLVTACIYAIIAAFVIALHIRENYESVTLRLLSTLGLQMALSALVLFVVGLAVFSRGQVALYALLPPSLVGDLLYIAQSILRELSPYQDWIFAIVSFLLLFAAARVLIRAWPQGLLRRLSPMVLLSAIAAVILLATSLTSYPQQAVSSRVLPTSSSVATASPVAMTPIPIAAPVPAAAPVPTVATPPPILYPAIAAGQERIFGVHDPEEILPNQDFGVEMFYTDLQASSIAKLGTRLQSVRQNGRVPMVTIEPFPLLPGTLPEQKLLIDLTDGRYDKQLRAISEVLHEYHGELFIRFAHEMELVNLYPWGAQAPQQYIAAYRHAYTLLAKDTREGLFWVWSPAGNADAAVYYPGDDVVDYVGFTALSAQQVEQRNAGQQRRTFTELMNEKYARVTAFGKPVVIAELGVSDTANIQVSWMRDMLRAVNDGQYPALRLIIYFNSRNAYNKITTVIPPDYTLTKQQWQTIRQELQLR